MDRDFTRLRAQMVERDLISRGIRDQAVLDAMRTIPRHQFVTSGGLERAYEDEALSLPQEQTVSQPYIVALMAEQAKLQPTDRLLEVGTGFGYAAAVFSLLCREVFTIERHPQLANQAAQLLVSYANVHSRCGDGTLGWPEAAPFDAIIVAAAATSAPPPLLEQLAVGGRLVIPLGPPRDQHLVRITRTSAAEYAHQELIGVRFVPLIGVHPER